MIVKMSKSLLKISFQMKFLKQHLINFQLRYHGDSDLSSLFVNFVETVMSWSGKTPNEVKINFQIYEIVKLKAELGSC